jgi:histidyl-tRNA synthetase
MLYPDVVKLEKQLKYADQKGIPYVVIIGPDEAAGNNVLLKNLDEKTQEVISAFELVGKVSY